MGDDGQDYDDEQADAMATEPTGNVDADVPPPGNHRRHVNAESWQYCLHQASGDRYSPNPDQDATDNAGISPQLFVGAQ